MGPTNMAKGKNQKRSISSFLESISALLNEDDVKQDNFIPDIITFIESSEYLGLAEGKNPIHLYPVQKIILKAFYRGSVGNEDISLSDDEIQLCRGLGMIDDERKESYSGSERGDLVNKYLSKKLFNELVLVWGRRAGKDFMASLIALYEAMKLLEVPGGDPHSYYHTAPGEPIYILTIANSKGQAGIAFNMIREKLRNSKYFEDKYDPEGLESSRICLLTTKDKENNKKWVEKGESKTKGNVIIEVGHSNSDTLIGKGCFVLILDEVASYTIGTGGSGSGERIYAALSPTISTYFRLEIVLDEDGNPILKENGEPEVGPVYDGKKISISSPRGKEGKLWELYENDPNSPKQLLSRLPTWDVNPYQNKKALREDQSSMSEDEFYREFGAEFSGTAGENMFDRDAVLDAFASDLRIRDIGEPGRVYFAHLDPATNSHNYALVVCHVEMMLDKKTSKHETYIIVDHIKYWSPGPGRTINIEEVDEYVIGLKKRFHLGLVTYDQWNSSSSMQKMKKNGIPAKVTPYHRKYKMQIYTELENTLNARKIKIPKHQLLKDEMLELQRKFNLNSGFQVYPKREGDGCKTDDITDALAGSVFNCINAKATSLPRGRLANTGIFPQSSNINWRSMQGTSYGQREMKIIDRIRGGGSGPRW